MCIQPSGQLKQKDRDGRVEQQEGDDDEQNVGGEKMRNEERTCWGSCGGGALRN